jgi:hypothetical protein
MRAVIWVCGGLLIFAAGVWLIPDGEKPAPCSAYVNTPVKDVPANCLRYFEGPTP